MITTLAVLSALALTAIFAMATHAYLRRRRVRVVHCPVTAEVVAVRIDPLHGLVGHNAAPRITSCSRWPAQRRCAQACVAEIEGSPDGCAFQAILSDWYRGKDCWYCRRLIAPASWGAPRPALLSPGGRVVDWAEITPESLFRVLASHRPVCSSCAAAEEFRQRYPDRFLERPPHHPSPSTPSGAVPSPRLPG